MNKARVRALIAVYDHGPELQYKLGIGRFTLENMVADGLVTKTVKRALTFTGEPITVYSISEAGRAYVLETGQRHIVGS